MDEAQYGVLHCRNNRRRGRTHQRNRRGGNLPPATLQMQPVLDEWYHPRYGITQCSGDDSSPCNVANTTHADKTAPPTDMSFRANGSEPRNLPELQILSCGSSLSNVVDSSTPLRCGRNDITGRRFYGFAYCFYSISRCPAALIRLAQASQLPPREALVPHRAAYRLNLTLFCPEGSRNGTQAVPYGFADGRYHSTAQVVFATQWAQR